MPNLDHRLFCPMQCRANGVDINECLRMYCSEPTEESHSIIAHDDDEQVIILFFLRGVTSLFHTFSVEASEFERHGCPRVELTSSQLTWDPSSAVFEDQENGTINYRDKIRRPRGDHKPLTVIIR